MPNSNFGNIQYKASNGLIKLDELEGIVECFVSGIGNKDSVGDICATGAFAKSLQRRKPRVVWGHNWNDPIGKVLEIYEVPASDPRLPMKMKMAGIGGLYAKVQFNLQSEKGKEAFANVAFFGEEQEWSIGYKTLRAQFDENLQANVLYEVELYEVSPVLHGANQLTGTISVKSDEEKMHGMMPMSISAPTSSEPRRDGIFDEGVSQRITGTQLAGIVAELSRRAAGPVMVIEATENSVVFVKPGKGKFRIGYHFTGSEYMFGKPELIQAEQPKPAVQSGPSPMPDVVGKPNKPSTNNPAMAMPVAMKPGNGGMIMVPLSPVEYEGSEDKKKPELGAEESELAQSLVRIAGKYGKFDEDGDGIWAGYYPPAENKVKDIGVKCSNCVLYLGEGKCKILDLAVEDEGKCRFAIIPDGVVVGFGKKEYSDILDDEEIKMIEDIEAKYPGEFILGGFRNLVKKRRKKRKSYKTLEEWGTEEQELEEKGLDPFLAHEYSYVIPVNLEDAFEFKSIIDPVLDYHRIDTIVNEYGIVINSPLSQESKDAISTATTSAYAFLKKKITSENIEEKALGRRIAGRAIDRPSIGGKKRRSGRGMGMPSGDLDPRTRRDSNLDGTLFDNVPGWEQPDPTPGGPGSIDNPKPSKRQLTDSKKPDGKEKLSSGAKNTRRHADRSADMEKQFPNAEENQKRIDHEAIAKAWEDQGLGWEEVPRYNADKNLSSDFLRGREIGVNQARVMWDGDSVRKRPDKFNEKQKASNEYSNWYSSYAKSVSAYLDAHGKDDSDNWDGIESALKADVKSKYPDTQDWAKEDIATLNEYLNDIGLLDGVQKPAPKKSRDSLSSGEKKPQAPKRTTGKLSSGNENKPAPKKNTENLSSGRDDGIMSILFPSAKDMTDEQLLRELANVDSNFGKGPFGRGVDSFGRRDFAAEERRDRERIREIRYELSTRGISASEIKKRDPLIGRSRLASGRTTGGKNFVSDLEKQMAKETEPLEVSAYGASQSPMLNTSSDNNPELDFDMEVQEDLMSHQDGAELVGHTVKLTDGRRGVVVSGTGPEYEVLEQDEDRRQRGVQMYSGDISVLITTDKDGNTLDKFIEEDFDFNMESDSRVIDQTMDWDKEIEDSKTDNTVGALVEKNRIEDGLLRQIYSSDRMSSGKRSASGRRKEIESLSSKKPPQTRTSRTRRSELEQAVHEEFDTYDDDTAWEYMEAVYGIEKSDYRYQRNENEYDSDDPTQANFDQAVSDLMSEDDQRNLLLATDEHESSPDYDAYKKTGPVYDAIKAKKERDRLSSGRSGGLPDVGDDDDGLKDEAEFREMERELTSALIDFGSSKNEAERVLGNWFDNDSRQDEYLAEYKEDGDDFNTNFARAATALYQDNQETLYDNRQSRNLSSGRKINKEQQIISDREIFERRMGGETLAETGSALGMKRQEVRQAELRHISRQRGAQQNLDLDDLETYREDQARMAAEEAAELSFNEAVYDRRMGGESLATTATALGMTREQVRRIEQTHLQLLRDQDKEAKSWLARQGGDVLGSGKKKYVSPIEDMNPGQRLSSGKLDEVYRSVQEQLIEQIQKAETEGGKWEFPWHRDASLPRNAMNNNRPYSGINSLMLMFRKDAMGYETGMWAGFNQWKEKGGTVRKGEKGTMIIIPTIIPGKKDAEGNEVKAGSVFFKTGHVFNLDQIDGIDKEQFKMPQLSEEERVDELEKALSEVGAIVNHGGDRAFYRPSTDEITLPPFSSFKSKEAYYAVFAHELMHWTGHKDRLNRDHLGDFGSPEYAQEELVAEIASAFFMTAHGLTPEPREDHAQYLASWLKKLKSDPDALKSAFEQAQKAHDFAISKSPSMSKKLGKKVAEAGVLPGNGDSSYGGIAPSLSSGARDGYIRNIDGSARTLADELGMPDDEVLDRFAMRRPYRDGDKNYYEASASLGDRGVNQWSMSQDDSGEWFAELMFMDGVGENDEIDWDVSGISSEGFKSPADLAQWTLDYEDGRREWQKKFKQETDIEKIAEMLNEEEARRDSEYENSKLISRERMDRQEYVRMIAEIDESRLDWSPEDWADEASDIQAELSRDNSRFSSGARSRYDDKPVEEIRIVTDALKRTDEAGSNARYIASNLPMVSVEKYDFDAIRRNGEVVSFNYNGKPRMVYPTGMMAKKGGGVYFIGLDEESGQYRSFSLNKIEGLVDGADAPYNPTQPGVPQGAPRSSAQRTRNITSDRLGSGKVRPLDEVRTEIEEDARYENMVVQNAFGGTLGSKNRSGSVQRISLEDHQEATNSLDRLVALRNDLIRSLLDGKKVPADAYIFQIDQYADVSDEDFDLLTDIDDAIDAIHDQLSWREEQFSSLNDEIDEMKESIAKLESNFANPNRRGKVVDFESTMERHIQDADGDVEDALYWMKRDAESIIEALEGVDDAEDRFSPVSYEEQIAEIKKLIDSTGKDASPEEFASNLKDFYYSAVNGLEKELTGLYDTQIDFEDNGVNLDREDITGKPKDVFASRNLPNSDMVEGDINDFLEPGDAPGLSSGRKKRTQGSKRRPMSDEDRQAFADGVRQRAATIPGKKKPAPSKDEFDAGSLGSGRFRFPDSTKRRRIGEQISAATSIKVGKLSENNDRSPDGKWMLDASKLKLILKDDNGEILDTAEIAALMGISKAEAEKFNAPGAAISEADANTLVDRMFFNGSDLAAADSAIEAIWGFDSKPYWYDSRRGSQLNREEYADYMDEGIAMYGILSPEGFEETEQFVARETTRGGFELSTLADALGAKSGAEIAEALTFEVDGERITPTEVQIKKWKRSGIPTGIIEQLVESGVIPNAGDIFGEDGVQFDNSIKQFDLWKKVSDAIAKAGIKAKGSELDDVIGATKVQTRLKAFEKDGGVKFSKNVGKALRYNDDEVKEIVDRLNKKFGLNETVDSIKGGSSMSSGRRAARRISNTGNQATESLSSGRKNNGAPENITPGMQNELIGWAENAGWSGFAQSVFSQFKAKGFLTSTQWTRLLQLKDNSRKQR